MTRRYLSIAGCAILSLLTLSIVTLWPGRAARAQLAGGIIGPAGPVNTVTPAGMPQLGGGSDIQALDSTHFVVVTREARLVARLNSGDNSVQQMVLPVVVHYTVQNNKLYPLEHVRVPTGYREVFVSPGE